VGSAKHHTVWCVTFLPAQLYCTCYIAHVAAPAASGWCWRWWWRRGGGGDVPSCAHVRVAGALYCVGCWVFVEGCAAGQAAPGAPLGDTSGATVPCCRCVHTQLSAGGWGRCWARCAATGVLSTQLQLQVQVRLVQLPLCS
jgi:hypothetical protein